MTRLRALLWILPALAVAPCFSQDTTEPAPRFYQVEFVAKETEGKNIVNSRRYSLLMSNSTTTKGASIRMGTRVPVKVDAANTQFFDAGVSIDCRSLREVDRQLALDVTAEISSVVLRNDAPVGLPVVRNHRWTSNVLVDVGKPTAIFSSDDPNSNRTMYIEVTARPIGNAK